MNDYLNNIPKHWVVTELGNLCKIDTGKWNANHATDNGKYRFYTCAEEHSYCNTKRFSGDCIILPGNGANVGKVFYYSGEFDAYQRTYVLHNIKINPKLLYYNLLYKWADLNKDKQFGSATNFIRISNFNDYYVPLPPLNEQKRIVEKLDLLLPKVKSAKERLERIPVLLKKFRQSVLAAACSGKLTEEWREEYKRKTGEELPEWEEKSLENIFILEYGRGLPKRERISGPYPVVGSNGIVDYHNSYLIKGPAIVIGRKGSSGKVNWIEYDCFPIDTTFYVVPIIKIELKFVFYLLQYLNLENFSSGSAIPGLNRNEVYSIFISLPPLPEQEEIVRRVEKLFSIADKVEEEYKKAIKRVEKLEQSILAKAFRGELAEPDPNDEPAEILLQKILKEKEKIEAQNKNKRNSRKKKIKKLD